MTDRYPYAADLLLLLVLKAKQVGDERYEQYLSRLAAATFDRPHLFDLLQDMEQAGEEETGEVLELLQLEDLELAPIADPFEEFPSRLNESSAPVPENDLWPVDPAPEEVYSPPSKPEAKATVAKQRDGTGERATIITTYPDNNRWVSLAAAYHLAIKSAAKSTIMDVRPDDPQRFAHLNTLSSVRYDLTNRLLSLRRRPETNPRSAPTTPPAMVSETLADLLVRQGQYAHAVRVYQRLLLLYPEKKTIFAGLIEELKEKL